MMKDTAEILFTYAAQEQRVSISLICSVQVLFYSLVVNQHRRRDASLESQQNLMWEEANAKCLIHLVIFTVTSLKSYASLDPKFSISLSYLAGRGTIKQLLISS